MYLSVIIEEQFFTHKELFVKVNVYKQSLTKCSKVGKHKVRWV